MSGHIVKAGAHSYVVLGFQRIVKYWDDHSLMKAICPIVSEVFQLFSSLRLESVRNSWQQGSASRTRAQHERETYAPQTKKLLASTFQPPSPQKRAADPDRNESNSRAEARIIRCLVRRNEEGVGDICEGQCNEN